MNRVKKIMVFVVLVGLYSIACDLEYQGQLQIQQLTSKQGDL